MTESSRRGGNYFWAAKVAAERACKRRVKWHTTSRASLKQPRVPAASQTADRPQPSAHFTPRIRKSFRVFVAGGRTRPWPGRSRERPGRARPALALLRRLGLSAKTCDDNWSALLFKCPPRRPPHRKLSQANIFVINSNSTAEIYCHHGPPCSSHQHNQELDSPRPRRRAAHLESLRLSTSRLWRAPPGLFDPRLQNRSW